MAPGTPAVFQRAVPSAPDSGPVCSKPVHPAALCHSRGQPPINHLTAVRFSQRNPLGHQAFDLAGMPVRGTFRRVLGVSSDLSFDLKTKFVLLLFTCAFRSMTLHPSGQASPFRKSPAANDRSIRIHPRARRPGAQSEGRGCRHSPRTAGGADGPVRLGQEFAGLRHHLCGGSAPVCGEPVRLCPPVPGADGQAGRGPDRGPVPGHLHRAEDHLQEPPLHRRHGDGDSRLHAPALGAGGGALLSRHGPAHREPDHQPDGGQDHHPAGRHPPEPAGPGDPRPQGRVPQGDRRVAAGGLPAPEDRRDPLSDRGGPDPRQEVQARYRHRRGPDRGQGRHRAAAGGQSGDGAPPGRRPRHRRIRRSGGE